jgi:ferric-chelate reductase
MPVLNNYLGHIEWISDAVSKALEIVPSTLAVDIRIYITSASGPSLESQGGAGQSPVTSEKSSIDEKSEETDNIASLLAYSSVKVLSGRPDIRKELGEEVALSTGRLSVTGALKFNTDILGHWADR